MEDIYSNLDNYEDENSLLQLRSENADLKCKIEEITKLMSGLQEDHNKLKKEFEKLESNYSSLLRTAKAEIERKTFLITTLNKEKDQLILNHLNSTTNRYPMMRQFGHVIKYNKDQNINKSSTNNIVEPNLVKSCDEKQTIERSSINGNESERLSVAKNKGLCEEPDNTNNLNDNVQSRDSINYYRARNLIVESLSYSNKFKTSCDMTGNVNISNENILANDLLSLDNKPNIAEETSICSNKHNASCEKPDNADMSNEAVLSRNLMNSEEKNIGEETSIDNNKYNDYNEKTGNANFPNEILLSTNLIKPEKTQNIIKETSMDNNKYNAPCEKTDNANVFNELVLSKILINPEKKQIIAEETCMSNNRSNTPCENTGNTNISNEMMLSSNVFTPENQNIPEETSMNIKKYNGPSERIDKRNISNDKIEAKNSSDVENNINVSQDRLVGNNEHKSKKIDKSKITNENFHTKDLIDRHEYDKKEKVSKRACSIKDRRKSMQAQRRYLSSPEFYSDVENYSNEKYLKEPGRGAPCYREEVDLFNSDKYHYKDLRKKLKESRYNKHYYKNTECKINDKYDISRKRYKRSPIRGRISVDDIRSTARRREKKNDSRYFREEYDRRRQGPSHYNNRNSSNDHGDSPSNYHYRNRSNDRGLSPPHYNYRNRSNDRGNSPSHYNYRNRSNDRGNSPCHYNYRNRSKDCQDCPSQYNNRNRSCDRGLDDYITIDNNRYADSYNKANNKLYLESKETIHNNKYRDDNYCDSKGLEYRLSAETEEIKYEHMNIYEAHQEHLHIREAIADLSDGEIMDSEAEENISEHANTGFTTDTIKQKKQNGDPRLESRKYIEIFDSKNNKRISTIQGRNVDLRIIKIDANYGKQTSKKQDNNFIKEINTDLNEDLVTPRDPRELIDAKESLHHDVVEKTVAYTQEHNTIKSGPYLQLVSQKESINKYRIPKKEHTSTSLDFINRPDKPEVDNVRPEIKNEDKSSELKQHGNDPIMDYEERSRINEEKSKCPMIKYAGQYSDNKERDILKQQPKSLELKDREQSLLFEQKEISLQYRPRQKSPNIHQKEKSPKLNQRESPKINKRYLSSKKGHREKSPKLNERENFKINERSLKKIHREKSPKINERERSSKKSDREKSPKSSHRDKSRIRRRVISLFRSSRERSPKLIHSDKSKISKRETSSKKNHSETSPKVNQKENSPKINQREVHLKINQGEKSPAKHGNIGNQYLEREREISSNIVNVKFSESGIKEKCSHDKQFLDFKDSEQSVKNEQRKKFESIIYKEMSPEIKHGEHYPEIQKEFSSKTEKANLSESENNVQNNVTECNSISLERLQSPESKIGEQFVTNDQQQETTPKRKVRSKSPIKKQKEKSPKNTPTESSSKNKRQKSSIKKREKSPKLKQKENNVCVNKSPQSCVHISKIEPYRNHEENKKNMDVKGSSGPNMCNDSLLKHSNIEENPDSNKEVASQTITVINSAHIDSQLDFNARDTVMSDLVLSDENSDCDTSISRNSNFSENKVDMDSHTLTNIISDKYSYQDKTLENINTEKKIVVFTENNLVSQDSYDNSLITPEDLNLGSQPQVIMKVDSLENFPEQHVPIVEDNIKIEKSKSLLDKQIEKIDDTFKTKKRIARKRKIQEDEDTNCILDKVDRKENTNEKCITVPEFKNIDIVPVTSTPKYKFKTLGDVSPSKIVTCSSFISDNTISSSSTSSTSTSRKSLETSNIQVPINTVPVIDIPPPDVRIVVKRRRTMLKKTSIVPK